MGKGREVRFFDYVNHPYARVREALAGDAVRVFSAATRAAADRTRSVASTLHVNVAGVELAKEIAISVDEVAEESPAPGSTPATRIGIVWEASDSPALFPLMKAELAIYPLTATETQLDLSGRYEPPLGVLGGAVDGLVGHRLAEAAVHRFVRDVAGYLRRTLGDQGQG